MILHKTREYRYSHKHFFEHPVVLGKADGSFFKVLIEIYAKADDSINEESKPNSFEINNLSLISNLFLNQTSTKNF